jgi:predicted nucleic acid-binding protein
VVLVDSSVWIDLLREVQTPQTHILRQLLPRREAALTAVIATEIRSESAISLTHSQRDTNAHSSRPHAALQCR